MALEGSLREFSLADILQLLFFQKKTGVLLLQGRADRVRLLFHEGNIVDAESKKRTTEHRLGNVLVKRGLITEEALESAMSRQKDEGGKLGSALVRAGACSAEQIREVITFQISEIMVQVFSWREGRYEFTPQGVPIDRDVGVSLDTQHFLMEGLRMVDEWSEIGDRLTIDSVFRRTNREPEVLTPDEDEIFGLVDGESDVGTLSEFSGKDSFSVSTTLLSLQEKGLVAKKMTVEEVKEKTAEFEAKPAKRRRAKSLPGFSLLVVILLLGALGFSLRESFTQTEPALKPYQASAELDALRLEVETRLATEGRYPARVERTDPWGSRYVYQASSSGYTLFSPGPDRRAGTADDIR